MPVVTMQVTLVPRGDAVAADVQRAADAIRTAGTRARACVAHALMNDPNLPSGWLTVEARSPGHGEATTMTVASQPYGAAAATCIARRLLTGLGGDAEPTELKFQVQVVIEH